MSETVPAIGKSQMSREEEADFMLRNTAIRPAMAWLLVLAFLAMIVAVPLLQFVMEWRRNPGVPPQPLTVFSLLPSLEEVRSTRTADEAMRLMPPAEEIREYETALENGSVLSEWALPRTQALLTGGLGAGNEQAYVGVGGWLFYRPDVDYLTGRGFLDPAHLSARRRAAEGEAVEPDPLPAIVRFKRRLAERGIELIVMPVPSKPMVHPERLSRRFSPDQGLLQNASYPAFRQALEREGVHLFDPSGLLVESRRRTGRGQYLETDTHWTPEAMERAAAGLAQFVRQRIALPDVEPIHYRRTAAPAENIGDIAHMLKLPPGQSLYPPQQVRLLRVEVPGGEAWQPSEDADVLMLGDSFMNIYSMDGLGWGNGAGFVEQASYHLRRPLDKIVINAGGSYSTRQQLYRELKRGRNRLDGKRLVIWQFAMRDLMEGDWKLLDLPR